MNWMPGITLPTRLLSLVKNKSIRAWAAHANAFNVKRPFGIQGALECGGSDPAPLKSRVHQIN
jgi:hypothetical protein